MPSQLTITLKIMPEFLGQDRSRIKGFCAVVARRVQGTFPEAVVSCFSSSWADTVVEGIPEDDLGQEDVIREQIADIVNSVFLEDENWRTEERERGEQKIEDEASDRAAAPASAEAEQPGGAPAEAEDLAQVQDQEAGAAPEVVADQGSSNRPVPEETSLSEVHEADPLAGALFFKRKDLYTVFLPKGGFGIRLNAKARKHRVTVARALPGNSTGRTALTALFGSLGWQTAKEKLAPKVIDELTDIVLAEMDRGHQS